MVTKVLPSICSFPINRFERISIAGEGGSKEVWCVKDLASKTLKALARYRLPTDIEREEGESEEEREISVIEGEQAVLEKVSCELKILALIAGLQNVISLEGTTYEGNRPCLVMPYYTGGNLENAINRGDLTTNQKCQIALDLLHGLQQCQSRGIFIGDIKPANILLDKDLRATITDFGTAFLTDEVNQLRVDTYNLFSNVFAQLFNSNDGKYYAFINKLLTDYDLDSFPSIATILMGWMKI